MPSYANFCAKHRMPVTRRSPTLTYGLHENVIRYSKGVISKLDIILYIEMNSTKGKAIAALREEYARALAMAKHAAKRAVNALRSGALLASDQSLKRAKNAAVAALLIAYLLEEMQGPLIPVKKTK